MTPLIHILIRNKHRPELFKRCIESINQQTYKNTFVLVACDSEEAKQDAEGMNILSVYPKDDCKAPWNLYCNDMKAIVPEGWFFFMDNDDYLYSPTVLQELSEHLTEPGAVIVQFLRNGKPKPHDEYMDAGIIKEGYIGGGCLVLHSVFKDAADWDGELRADYRWIKSVTDKVPTKFIKLVLQVAGKPMYGK